MLQWEVGVIDIEKLLVDRRKDPNYEQVTGHVQKDLARRFKVFCTDQRITIAEALDKAIALFLQEVKESAPSKPQPKNIAEVVQQNYFALLSDGKIKPENLQVIASGSKPSNPDLARIAQILDIPDEQLKEMRDREFPNQSRRKQPNGDH